MVNFRRISVAFIRLTYHAYTIHLIIEPIYLRYKRHIPNILYDDLLDVGVALKCLVANCVFNIILRSRKSFNQIFAALESNLPSRLNFRPGITAIAFGTSYTLVYVILLMTVYLTKTGNHGNCSIYIQYFLYNSPLLQSSVPLGNFVCMVEMCLYTSLPALSFTIQFYLALRIRQICVGLRAVQNGRNIHLYQDMLVMSRNLSRLISGLFSFWLIEWSTAFVINAPILLANVFSPVQGFNPFKMAMWFLNVFVPVCLSVFLSLSLAEISCVKDSMLRLVHAEWGSSDYKEQIKRNLMISQLQSAQLGVVICKCFTIYKKFAFDFYFALVTYLLFITGEMKIV